MKEGKNRGWYASSVSFPIDKAYVHAPKDSELQGDSGGTRSIVLCRLTPEYN